MAVRTSQRASPPKEPGADAETKWAPHLPRGWKSTDAAAAAKEFFRKPRKAAVRELIRDLCSEGAFEHRCAAELARLVSQRQPGILAHYADILAEVAAALPMAEWQARGYVLVAAAHNATARPQRLRLAPLVRARLEEDRIAVRAMALEALAVLGARDPDLRDEALQKLEEARHSRDFALRTRARRMGLLVETGAASGRGSQIERSRRKAGI